jgi:hypothetical protein
MNLPVRGSKSAAICRRSASVICRRNPTGSGRADEIIGCGGSDGALSEFPLLTDAVKGQQYESVPHHIPFEVAALK